MSRGHRFGHHEPVEETLALLALASGASFNGTATPSTPLVLDTKFSPPAPGGAFVKVTVNAFDVTAPADAGVEYNVALRKTAGGVLTLAGNELIGAKTGDAALVADLAVTFSVSSSNTLVVNVAITGYPNNAAVSVVLSGTKTSEV